MANAAARADLANDRQDHIFCSDARRERAFNRDAHPLWSCLWKRLCCKHVFNFACANSKCERAECTVCCSVAIAAHNGHAWKRATLLGSYDVHDALLRITHWVQRDAKLLGVSAHDIDLFSRDWVGNWQVDVFGWHVVIFGCNCEIGATNFAIIDTQTVKCLRARYFMNKV